jgi:hypothetical protein
MFSFGGVVIDLSPGDADRGPTEVVVMDLHRARRDAKALLRAVRAGDPEALARDGQLRVGEQHTSALRNALRV